MESTRTEVASRRQIGSALTLAMVVLATAFAYWASPVLVPLALSVLFAFLLNPIVGFLQRRKVPRAVAAFLVTGFAVSIVSLLGWIFVSQVVQLAEQLPSYEKRVTDRIEEIQQNGKSSLFSKIQRFAKNVASASTPPSEKEADSSPQRVVLVGNEWSLTPLFSTLGPVLEPFAAMGLVIVQLIYLLIDGESLRDRFLRLAGKGNMTVTTRALDDASSRISRYLIAQFCLNLAFGVLVTVGLLIFGVPHALLCGLLAGFLRYIPYLGPWLALALPLLLSVISSNGWIQPVGVLVVFGLFELVSNVVVEPLVYGRSIGVSQSALIVAIAFWAFLWGPMGLVLAAPLTVCLAIMGKYIPSLKFFDIILGDSPPLTSEVRFYQRLLAHDEDGALQIASAESGKHSLAALYDQFLIPSLTNAKRDLLAERLGEADAAEIWTLTSEIGEEIALANVKTTKDTMVDAEEPLAKLRLLACPAHDGADQAALKLIQCVIDPQLVEVQLTSSNRLASEVTSLAEDSQSAMVLITSLPPGGVARGRLLCARLRQRLPDLKIVVARCGNESSDTDGKKRLMEAGADFVADTVEESVEHIAMIARLLRPAQAGGPKTAPLSSSEAANYDTRVA